MFHNRTVSIGTSSASAEGRKKQWIPARAESSTTLWIKISHAHVQVLLTNIYLYSIVEHKTSQLNPTDVHVKIFQPLLYKELLCFKVKY